MPEHSAQTAKPSVLAVIPARGGSKGIQGKNLVPLGGRPLLHWTIAAALAARSVDRVIVSSDSPKILRSATDAGAEVDRRGDDLADDDVHAVEVVLELLSRLETAAELPDIVVMLLPTSPFRTSGDIDGAIELFVGSNAPAVISVTPMSKLAIHLRTMEPDGTLVPFLPWDQLTAQRQNQPTLYALNGSIYVAAPEVLLANRTYHVQGSLGYPMDPQHSVDINEPQDLDGAQAAIAARRV